MPFASINPATEETIAEYPEHSTAEVDTALEDAYTAFRQWRRTTFNERSAPMHRLATVLRAHKDRYARLITAEMGKPITEAEAEIEKCALSCEYFADHAERFLTDEPVLTNARQSFVAFQPLGVVLAIMPWNFPFWQVLRFAGPALMAGNTALLKHAPTTFGCALAIEEAFQEAGFPHGALRGLRIDTPAVERLIANDRIAAVTLTGSERAGSAVGANAGKAIKRAVMELGGSDPFIVLADADLDGAVQFAVRSRYQNGGQSCIAAKRFIVEESIAEDFEERLVKAVGMLRVGDPSQRETQIGPLARADLRENLERQVQASVQQGATIAVGGRRSGDRGFFYAPTVLLNVQRTMPAFREETFGPVAAMIRVPDAETAIETANDSIYGLGGNLWTGDINRGVELARQIESGSVFINGMTASDPRLPFGGVKHSGYGRELSAFGIREFVNIQTIWVGPATN